MGPQINLAFRPPPLLPGGPPTHVQPCQPSTHRAETQLPGLTQHYTWPSLTETTVAATPAELTLHAHSLRTTLYTMAYTGIATTSLLQDAFRRFYGDGWEEAYKQPVIKDFFLREVREELTNGVYDKTVETISRQIELSEEQRTSAYASTQPEPPAKCPCPLHEHFGAAEDLRFPTCPRENELQANREWEGLDLSPHQ